MIIRILHWWKLKPYSTVFILSVDIILIWKHPSILFAEFFLLEILESVPQIQSHHEVSCNPWPFHQWIGVFPLPRGHLHLLLCKLLELHQAYHEESLFLKKKVYITLSEKKIFLSTIHHTIAQCANWHVTWGRVAALPYWITTNTVLTHHSNKSKSFFGAVLFKFWLLYSSTCLKKLTFVQKKCQMPL